MRRFHAETIDEAVSKYVCALVLSPHESLEFTRYPWGRLYDAMCAFGNLRLAQECDRLEDWEGLFACKDCACL
jgi:hypothetical protein